VSPSAQEPRIWLVVLLATLLTFGGIGCSSQSGPSRGSKGLEASQVDAAINSDRTCQAVSETDYDPWERFNDRTFWFNHDVLDRYALKPAATAWAKMLPAPVRQSLGNAFENVAMPRRLVNELLQARFGDAGRELVRFALNSTAGIAGFFDIATRAGIEKTDADTGQTLGVYGVGPGPYLVLPLLPPLTVRDGIGYAADSALDPLSYFVTPLLADLGRGAAKTINERADNLELYQEAEDSAIDLYGAVRNGYLQRREKSIEDAIGVSSWKSGEPALAGFRGSPNCPVALTGDEHGVSTKD